MSHTSFRAALSPENGSWDDYNTMGQPGDEFDAVFERLYPRARDLAHRLLGSVPDAEEAAAEAFTRALVQWGKVSRLGYLDAWVLRVTANVAIDMGRKRRRRLAAGPFVEDSATEDAAARLHLEGALRRLPRRQQEAIVLRHLADLSEADVAEALGVSVNSVKTHVQRGLAALRTDAALLEPEVSS